MATNKLGLPPLPEGFVLEETLIPPLPPGFELESPKLETVKVDDFFKGKKDDESFKTVIYNAVKRQENSIAKNNPYGQIDDYLPDEDLSGIVAVKGVI